MTLHKIDREKLAEKLEALNSYEIPYTIEQAAQNWLTITDPGFEVSGAMCDAADNIEGWEGRYINKMFKAMIAKAGE